FDGIVLARAGLARLGRENEATEIFPADALLPAVGQGLLGLQVRQDDAALQKIVGALDHQPSRQAAEAERAFLEKLGGDCQTPIAGYARLVEKTWRIDGLVASNDGQTVLKEGLEFEESDAAGAGRQLAERLLARGADQLLAHA